MTSPNKILVDLAVAREAARVTAQEALDERRAREQMRRVVADRLAEMDKQGLRLTYAEKALVIVDAIENSRTRSGS